MLDIQRKALINTATMLTGMGAQYYIVFDNETFGELPKSIKARVKHDYNTYFDLSKLETLEPGEVIVVPWKPNAGNITLGQLASTLSARAINKWGRGSFSVAVNRQNNTAEGIRQC